MTMLEAVAFPATFDELAGMPSAELRVLVGKLPNGTDLHPKIASMGYHMSKAQRLDFIGHHYYGVKSVDAANIALADAEIKYAEHQAKKGKKTGPIKSVPPAGGVATNCSATAGKALTELAQNVTPIQKLTATVNAWAKNATDMALEVPGGMPHQWFLQADELASAALQAGESAGPAQKLAQLFYHWDKAITAEADDELFNLWTFANNLQSYASGQDPELAGALKVLAHSEAAKLKTQAVVGGLKQVDSATLAALGDSAPSPQAALEALEKLADADIAQLAPPTIKGLANLASETIHHIETDFGKALVDDALAAAHPQVANKLAGKFIQAGKKIDQQVPEFAGEIQDVLPTSQLNDFHLSIQQAHEDAAELAKVQAATAKANEEALAAAAKAADTSDAVLAKQAEYGAMSKAELKKIGPANFKLAGVDTPSLAHYLTKSELAEALAKIEYDPQPSAIADLLDIAQAKKAAHKTGAKAAKVADTADTSELTGAQQAAKAAADEAVDPKTVAAIEDSHAPEFTPAPDTLGVPQTKHPKPAQTQHTWKPKANQENLGGAHTKYQYVDEDGKVWMWKKAETKGVADGEALAHDIGWDLGFDMADIRYAKAWQVPTKGTFPHGTVQKFHDGIVGDMRKVGVADMTPQQLSELQEHQVFDWLISQHDTHSENILIASDGHLVPIDKGQAFKFFGNDKLEVGYSPPGNFGKPVYYDMWDEYAAGRIDLDLDDIDNVLARIESIPDAEYRTKVESYVKQRFADGSGIQFLPKNLRSEKALVNAIMERKANVRAELTDFYKAQAKRRGIKWDPVWEKRLAGAKPEVVAELGEKAVTAGIQTPITKTLAETVAKKGTGGQAIKVAGKDIYQGQALAYVEEAADGSKILRLELRLELDADKRLTETLKGITGDLGTGNAQSGGYGYVADNEWATVEKFAKTVGAHASDGAYNAGTVQQAQSLLSSIPSKIDGYGISAQKKLLAGDIEGWAADQAQAEKLLEYKKHLESIESAMQAQTVPPYKAQAFDVTKATKGWEAKAPAAPAQVTEEASEDIFKSLTVGTDRFPVMERTDDYLGWKRTGGSRDVTTRQLGSQKMPGPSAGTGRQFDGVVDVGGTDVSVHFRSYETTSAITRKGLLDVEIPDWDGTQEGIDKALAAMGRMGVDVKLATAEDEALTYWRVLTGTFKNSSEYVNGTGTGPYGKVRSTIDAIEAKVAKAGDLSPADEAAIYRDAWAETFGADAVAKAPERLISQRDIFGDEMGYGFVHRFDLPDDLSKNFGSGEGGWVHGTSHLTGKDVTSLPGAASTSELIRHGTYGSTSTTSAAADLYSGGGSGVFAKRGWGHHYTSNNEIVLARPATTDLRVGTYNFHGDQFGSLAMRDSAYSLDPAQSVSRTLGGGENIVRGNISFGEDTEAIIYRSKAKYEEALRELDKLGITEIRGRPVTERIYYARSDADARTTIKALSKDRKDSLYRPYDDVVPPKVTDPVLPPKAKATRPKKVTDPVLPEPDVPLATESTTAADPFKVTAPGQTDPGVLANAFSDVATSLDDSLDSVYSYADLEELATSALADEASLTTAEAKALWEKASKMSGHSTKQETLTAGGFGGKSELTSATQALQEITEEGTNYAVLSKLIDGKAPSEALDILKQTDWLHTGAAKQHMAELVGEPDYLTMLKHYNGSTDLQNNHGSLLGWVHDTAAAADGPGTTKKLTQAQAGKLHVADPITPLTVAAPGQKVAAGTLDMVYSYKIPGIGQKVDVQFSKFNGQDYVIAKLPEAEEWFLLGTKVGKTTKADIIQMMVDVGWPKAKLA